MTFLAGAASTNVDPPLGLPMMGVVRRPEGAQKRLGPLEVTAAAFEGGGVRVVICGVDTLAIQAPEVDAIRDRIAAQTGAQREGILLNWSHTHHAPPGGKSVYGSFGERDATPDAATVAYVEELHESIIATCVEAFARLEEAWVRSGLGYADLGINRRQRDPDGRVTTIGWNPDGLVDRSVPVLQAIRPDGSAIVTIVGYGAHTVTTGVNYIGYSPDYPGWLRAGIRELTGGDCVFLQGAAGNVMPLYAFDDSCEAPQEMGRRLALEAAHAIADRPAWPPKLLETGFASGTALALFRRAPAKGPEPVLAAAEEQVEFPLLPLPAVEEIERELRAAERELEEAEARGTPESGLRILRYHGLNWLRRTYEELRSGKPRTSASGPVAAIRIGDAAIVTGPGEVFTEIGLAIKERSPAEVTFYAGYSNGCISYMPIASEYPLGGYEPSYGHKTYGLPAQVAPGTERLLIETGVSLVAALFPDRPTPEPDGWLASGALPRVPETPEPVRPEPAA